MKEFNVTDKYAAVASQYTKERDYWLNKFSGELEKCFPAYDKMPRNTHDREMETHSFRVTGEMFTKLTYLSNRSDLRLYMVLATAWAALLNKYTGSSDITMGSAVLKQSTNARFVNTVLPLKNTILPGMTFKELLLQVRGTISEAVENANYPIETLIYKLNLPLSETDFPLFDTAILLENIHDPEYILHVPVNMFVFFKNTPEGLEGTVRFNSSRYEIETIKRIESHFRKMLEVLLAGIDSPLTGVDILPPREKQQLLEDFNQTEVVFPDRGELTLHRLFRQRAAESPGEPAVIFESRRLSYRELDEEANRMADFLITKGLKPGDIAGIMLGCSLKQIIALLAVLKAGGAFLPLDIDYPPERIEYMMKNSGADMLLVEGDSHIDVKRLVNIDDPAVREADGSDPGIPVRADRLAYVIYTSGTTGLPKAVGVEHRNAVNTLVCRRDSYNMGPGDISLQLFSFSFDGFITSFFTPIISGAAVVVLSREGVKDIEKIKEAILQEKVSHFISVPPLYRGIIESLTVEEVAGIKVVTLAGDKVSSAIIEETRKKNENIRLVNEYGVTEAAVMSSIHWDQQEDTRIRIGKPAWNTRIYILDHAHRLQPIGVPGELCIGGDGVARGYLNNSELTNEKFIENPYHKGRRLYKTGDMGRWHGDGVIELMGRKDHQVKLRGYRIELGEIENQLSTHEEVKETVVLLKEDQSEDKCLCAYYVAGSEIPVTEIRAHLSGKLPGYMIPMYFVHLERFPLTPNGKLNRRALPEPEFKAGAGYVAPRTNLEKDLVRTWSQILNTDQEMIGIDTNFFEMGGHSLKATKLVGRIQADYNAKLPLGEVFKKPTIRLQADYIKDITGENQDRFEITPTEKRDFYPLSSAQKRLFILQQITPQSTAYNVPGTYIFKGKPDKNRFKRAFEQLAQRHEVMRTSFHLIEGKPVQKITQTIDIDIPFHSCREEDVEEKIKLSLKPFDISRAPLFRVRVFQVSEEKHYVFFDMHHIIFDGTSMEILVRDFAGFYQGKLPEPLTLQYKDYAAWENSSIEDGQMEEPERYWLEKLKGFQFTRLSPGKLTGYNRSEGESVQAAIDGELFERIRAFCHKHDVTRFVFMLTVFNLLLANEIEQDDITIGIPASLREHEGLKNLLGIFLNVLLIRSEMDDTESFIALLSKNKQTVSDALNYQFYPYDLLAEKLRTETSSPADELFTIFFNYLSREEHREVLADEFEISSMGSGRAAPKYDITLYIADVSQSLQLNMVYKGNLFDGETMRGLMERFVLFIRQLLENENSPALELLANAGSDYSGEFQSDFDELYDNDDLM